MMKLNNKGMTIVEILVCFIVVAFISAALFSTVTAFSNKRNVESAKAELIEYRNEIVKMIEDDLIHKGLTNATVKEEYIGGNQKRGKKYTVTLYFRDGSKRTLIINSQRAGDYGSSGNASASCTDNTLCTACTGFNDDFWIQYNGIKYPLPDVGDSTNECSTPEVIKDLRFNTIKVSNEDNVLLVYVNFYHPELGSDYSINIIAPINYFA